MMLQISKKTIQSWREYANEESTYLYYSKKKIDIFY